MKVKLKRKKPVTNKGDEFFRSVMQSPFAIDVNGRPFYDPERDGITYSLLSTFADCREKARLHLQGWTPTQMWMATNFGGIVHGILERIYVQIREGKIKTIKSLTDGLMVKMFTQQIEVEWKKENPKADAETKQDMEFVLLLAEQTLPWYFQYWYRDFEELKWEALESEFRVPLTVTSLGSQITRTTFIRGKIDGIFRFAKRMKMLRLLETKTRSHIDAGTIADVLPYEWQVNIYLTATKMKTGKNPGGVLYNMIRRPQLRQKKGESLRDFATRISNDINKRPDFYFVRLELAVSADDLAKFQGELHQITGDFLDWWHGRQGHYKESGHCVTRYGTCPMLPICGRNDYTRHYKRETVFRELVEEV
jgi:hypothetical protein